MLVSLSIDLDKILGGKIHRVSGEHPRWVTPSPLLLSNISGHFLPRNPCLSGNRSLLSTPALCLTVPPTVCAGREAPRTGETSVPQHTQEAHGVSTGPAGSRGRQALGKCPLLSPGVLDPVSWHPASPSHPLGSCLLRLLLCLQLNQASLGACFCCEGAFAL